MLSMPLIETRIHQLLRKAAVSSSNLTPHSLLQMKNNSSDPNESSADSLSYLNELSRMRAQHNLHQPFKSNRVFLFLETAARELCVSIESFLIAIYSPFHLG